MRFVKDASALVTYRIKPQMKTLGPKYGKLLNAIRTYLETCDGAALVSAVKGGVFTAEIGGAQVELTEADLLISTESAEGYVSASDKGITVALNTRLTPALIEEGIERELISKIQTMRKEAGFAVTDHIRVTYAAGANAAAVLEGHKAQIAAVVLADEISAAAPAGYVKEWEIGEGKVTLGVEKK